MTQTLDQKITALFRLYLREELPSLEDSDLARWRWRDGPQMDFKPLQHDDPVVFGSMAAGRVYHAIALAEFREGPLATCLPIRWRLASH